jgi:hypothetical protein
MCRPADGSSGVRLTPSHPYSFLVLLDQNWYVIAPMNTLIAMVLAAGGICPSEFSKVAPSPEELAKLCPDEKVFAEPADVENTGNPLFCSYTFGHKPKAPSIPIGRYRVGSNEGRTMADAAKATDPKAVAERTAQGLVANDIKAAVTKMPWKGAEAYRVDTELPGLKREGESYFVKSSKGVVTVQLKNDAKVPACVEKVVEYIAKH